VLLYLAAPGCTCPLNPNPTQPGIGDCLTGDWGLPNRGLGIGDWGLGAGPPR
jgi:hypothetical protein